MLPGLLLHNTTGFKRVIKNKYYIENSIYKANITVIDNKRKLIKTKKNRQSVEIFNQ